MIPNDCLTICLSGLTPKPVFDWIEENTPKAFAWYTQDPTGLNRDRLIIVLFYDIVQATFFKMFWADHLYDGETPTLTITDA